MTAQQAEQAEQRSARRGGPSPRGKLARLALSTALVHPAVAAALPGPGGVFRTEVSGERLTGVRVTAAPGGRYAIGLCLEAGLAPLPALASELRREIRRAAARSALAEEAGPIDIRFESITATEPSSPRPQSPSPQFS